MGQEVAGTLLALERAVAGSQAAACMPVVVAGRVVAVCVCKSSINITMVYCSLLGRVMCTCGSGCCSGKNLCAGDWYIASC